MFNSNPTYFAAGIDMRAKFAVVRPCDQGWLHADSTLVGRSKR